MPSSATSDTEVVGDGARDIYDRSQQIIASMREVSSLADEDLRAGNEVTKSAHTISSQLDALSRLGQDSAEMTNTLYGEIQRFRTGETRLTP